MNNDKNNNPNGIGTLPVDPNAEPSQTAVPVVSGQQEADFYSQAGAEFELRHHQQDLGLLGQLFGSSASAPTNIAGGVIILCFLFIFVSLFLPASADMSDTRKTVIAVISSALAFIFGAASKK